MTKFSAKAGLIILIAACVLLLTTTIFRPMEHNILGIVEETNVRKITVTAYGLNVRSGIGTRFTVVDVLYKGEEADVLGKVGNWYIIHTKDDVVGAVSSNYTKPVTPSSKPNPTPQPNPDKSSDLSYQQSKMLELVNSERSKAGLKPLLWDADLARVANYKAIDMVQNNYFSHSSPTYGSPFDMMKQFGIQYRAAGENLAGYNDVIKAHNGLMNSDGHRKNILNSSFTHIGIGVQNSPRYGYVFVQMFVGR